MLYEVIVYLYLDLVNKYFGSSICGFKLLRSNKYLCQEKIFFIKKNLHSQITFFFEFKNLKLANNFR